MVLPCPAASGIEVVALHLKPLAPAAGIGQVGSVKNTQNIAIIGAGLAGLTAAAYLRARYEGEIVIFDKGRRPGGRLAARRHQGVLFNHGAQFATARDPRFLAWLQARVADGKAALWPETSINHDRYVGLPDMNALADAPISAVETGRHVSFAEQQGEHWYLYVNDAKLVAPGHVGPTGSRIGPFDQLILALPAPQAAAFLAGIGHYFAEPASIVTMAPCWTVMLGFPPGTAGPDILLPAHSPLSWVAREACRPGNRDAAVGYTVQASPAWSRAHLEDDAQAVQDMLAREFIALSGVAADPDFTATHRWRYAQSEISLGVPCLWDEERNLGVCGDWCMGNRLESAFCSGIGMAEAVLAHTSMSVRG